MFISTNVDSIIPNKNVGTNRMIPAVDPKLMSRKVRWLNLNLAYFKKHSLKNTLLNRK